MASDTDICSDALVLLGDDPIISLDDTSDRATACKQLYSRVRDAVLRAYPWKFATARAQLAQAATIPAYGWAFQYPLPTNYLRLIEFAGDDMSWIDGSGGWGDRFTIEGRNLLTNSTTAFIRYVQRVTDTTLFDAAFVAALTARMAYELAQPITSNGQIVTMMKAAYADKLAEAQQLDGQSETPPSLYSEALTNVR